MGDDFDRDDPHVGPAHLPGADAGGSVTIDDQGHIRAVDVTVPGTGEGSAALHWEPGSGDSSGRDPGWMPHPHDPDAGQAPPLPDIYPPIPGWVKNEFDGKWYPPVTPGSPGSALFDPNAEATVLDVPADPAPRAENE
jgi:hypothetical protein